MDAIIGRVCQKLGFCAWYRNVTKKEQKKKVHDRSSFDKKERNVYASGLVVCRQVQGVVGTGKTAIIIMHLQWKVGMKQIQQQRSSVQHSVCLGTQRFECE